MSSLKPGTRKLLATARGFRGVRPRASKGYDVPAHIRRQRGAARKRRASEIRKVRGSLGSEEVRKRLKRMA